jgi:hypothetical protein
MNESIGNNSTGYETRMLQIAAERFVGREFRESELIVEFFDDQTWRISDSARVGVAMETVRNRRRVGSLIQLDAEGDRLHVPAFILESVSTRKKRRRGLRRRLNRRADRGSRRNHQRGDL